MIGKIIGTVSSLEANVALVQTVGGVGYLVYLTPPLLSRAIVGEEIELITYLHVKEDGLTLFGFENTEKFRLFQLFLGVDGVGPKLAYTIISFASVAELIGAVTAQNPAFFSSIPHVGKKTAHKILLELSSKLDTEFAPQTFVLSKDEVTILDAIGALGFDRKEAQAVLPTLKADLVIEEKIKEVIRELTKK